FPGWQLGLDQRLQWEEMSINKVAVTCCIANACMPDVAQHPAAFPRHRRRVSQVMVDLRHEREINRTVRERQRICRSLSEHNVPGNGLPAGLIQHSPGRIDPDDLGAEMDG